MALSEWVDNLPEPWAAVLRFLPITGAFFLGLLLVLLWKRKPLPEQPRGVAQVPPSLRRELQDSVGKSNTLGKRAAPTGRGTQSKDRELEKLRTQSAAPRIRGTAVADAVPVQIVAKGDTGVEPPGELLEFAAGSEKLARAAAQFRKRIRAEAEGEELAADDNDGQNKAPPDWGEMLLFRSHDPSIWNQAVDGGEEHRAVPLAEVPGNAAFLRLRRVDTGEGVVIPIEAGGLATEGDGGDSGFNGSAEEFYGARHLGIFHENLPQEVEIRFAYGGWGFGHRADGGATQALGWAGKEISGDTVLEITVFPCQPEMAPGDRLLELI